MQQQLNDDTDDGQSRGGATPPPPLARPPAPPRHMGMGLGMGMMGMGMGMGYGSHMGGWGYGYLMAGFPGVGGGSALRPPLFSYGMHRPPFTPNGDHDFNNNNQNRGFKRFGGPSYDNQRGYSRGRARGRAGYGGHHWGYHGRGHGPGHRRDLLTKEALDADLDQWRMKDKKSAGESLDADLDEYWRRKNDGSEQVKSEFEDSSSFEKRDSSDVALPKRTGGSGSSLRPSKTMRSTPLDSQD